MRVKLDPGAFMPERAHATDAGADLRSPVDIMVPACTVSFAAGVIGDGERVDIAINPQAGRVTIDTGVHIELPPGTVGLLKSKSGLNVRHNITSEGIIDEGYTGSIQVKLYNHGSQPYYIKRGDKITQLLVMPVEYVTFEQVDELEETERGAGGFGSTGK